MFVLYQSSQTPCSVGGLRGSDVEERGRESVSVYDVGCVGREALNMRNLWGIKSDKQGKQMETSELSECAQNITWHKGRET